MPFGSTYGNFLFNCISVNVISGSCSQW